MTTDDAAALIARFEGREAFRQSVRDALSAASTEGWREILLCDASFADWPLGERAVADALQAWAHQGHRFVMLAQQYDGLIRLHPRFVEWRRTWSHKIDCRVCRRADAAELPSAIWSPAWMLLRLDPVRCIGVQGTDAGRRVALKEQLDSCLERSSAGFPATTLGL